MMTGAKAARQRAGLSLEEAARRLRLSIGYLRYVEGARSTVPKNLLARMATLYGVWQDEIQPAAVDSPEGTHGDAPAAPSHGRRG